MPAIQGQIRHPSRVKSVHHQCFSPVNRLIQFLDSMGVIRLLQRQRCSLGKSLNGKGVYLFEGPLGTTGYWICTFADFKRSRKNLQGWELVDK